jgi:hypothetical protein
MAHQWISSRVVVETEHYGSNQSAVVGSEGVALIDAPHLPSDALAWGHFAKSLGNVRFLINSDHKNAKNNSTSLRIISSTPKKSK